jgi:hypothetical protein
MPLKSWSKPSWTFSTPKRRLTEPALNMQLDRRRIRFRFAKPLLKMKRGDQFDTVGALVQQLRRHDNKRSYQATPVGLSYYGLAAILAK